MKKAFSFLLVLAGLFVLTSNEAKAQMPAIEVTIGNTNSTYYVLDNYVVDCTNPSTVIGFFRAKQAPNTGVAHYYNNVVGEYTYFMEVHDDMGIGIGVGAPGSGYPSWVIHPSSGDVIQWHYFGCGHPSVVTIN